MAGLGRFCLWWVMHIITLAKCLELSVAWQAHTTMTMVVHMYRGCSEGVRRTGNRLFSESLRAHRLKMKSVAVIGGGICGLSAAIELAYAGMNVVMFEKNDYFGGELSCSLSKVDLDHSFVIFNPATDPNVFKLFERIGVDTEESELSFSISLDEGYGYEWGSRNGFSSLFTQKSNAINPSFWKLLQEINKYKDDSLRYLETLEQNLDFGREDTLRNVIKTRGYSDLLLKSYLAPICSSVWPGSLEGVLSFSAYSVLSFFRDHNLFEPFGCSKGLVIRWQTSNFIKKIREILVSKGCQMRSNCEVHSVTTTRDGCVVAYGAGCQETYDECIMAIHTSSTLKLLGKEATFDATRALGAFQYVDSDIFLHCDQRYMPLNPAAWSMFNFHGMREKKVSVTYWLNILQNGNEKAKPYLVTLNPSQKPENTLIKWSTNILLPTIAASKASLELDHIQGKSGLWFCKRYLGYGFAADELKAGIVTAHSVLGKSCNQLRNPKHIVLSTREAGARILVTRFFRNYISTGCLILLEEGGSVYTFSGTNKKCTVRTTLRIHNPRFYWKIATEADLGLADAYIHGDFSMVDGNEGLFNLILILALNRVTGTPSSKLTTKRGWWTPSLSTATIASAKFFFKHLARKNTITQARRNISRHYDLSNELFAMFLDETMSYTCAVFKSDDEDLKVAQKRKLSLLIEKARIEKEHEVLEIGCGWGNLAIEVVKRTGCKYTGVSLTEEPIRFAESKVKESGLQDRIKFLVSDYRELPSNKKYDRIISVEMIEHVGHEYFEEFFSRCESLLAEDGIFVLQFISCADSEYDEIRRSAGFIREYIFPGGCSPSLARVASAMASSSRLCVEHLENIGIHYCTTLRCWRKNFLENKSKIMDLGFDEKFIRTWEYYFDYCAAGFKSRMMGNYQIVFSRPGNLSAFSDPYKGFPSAYE